MKAALEIKKRQLYIQRMISNKVGFHSSQKDLHLSHCFPNKSPSLNRKFQPMAGGPLNDTRQIPNSNIRRVPSRNSFDKPFCKNGGKKRDKVIIINLHL